jgi:hypothetical protein
MHFLKHLLQPKSSNRRRSTRTQSNSFALETLEPRIAFDASGLEGPTLEPVCATSLRSDICEDLSPTTGMYVEIALPRTQNFTITHIAEGITVEKWDAESNQWKDIATTLSTSHPKEIIRVLEMRVFKPDDRYRVTRANENIDSDNPFQAVWADGSEARGLISRWMPGLACGARPRPLPIRSPSGEWIPLVPVQIVKSDPTQPLLFWPTDLIDKNLTPTNRAFIDLSMTNPVDTVVADEEEVIPDLVAPILNTAKLTNTDLAFADPALITLVNADLTDSDLNGSTKTKKSSFATILPTAFESAATVIQPIN